MLVCLLAVCLETLPYNTSEILQSDDVYDNLSKMDGVMFDVFVNTTSGECECECELRVSASCGVRMCVGTV